MKLLSHHLHVERAKRLARQIGLATPLHWYREVLSPEGRRARRRDQADLAALGEQFPTIASQIERAAGAADAVALMVSYDRPNMVAMQLPIFAGMAAAGITPVPILSSLAKHRQRALYNRCGVNTFAAWDMRVERQDHAPLLERLAEARSQNDVVALRWRGVAVGKYAVSTLMRRLRQGHIDPAVPEVRRLLHLAVARTAELTDTGFALLEQWRPSTVVVVDRGYSPEGPLFEACLQRGIAPISFNAAHRDNTLMLKRYGGSNATVHPSSLSDKSWAHIRSMPWGAAEWGHLSGELEQCYTSGQWYGEVGTQFNTRPIDRTQLLARLSLDPAKRTVLLFPHIFWDATFFWGEDVFRDYEDWFRETVRTAWSTDSVNWIVKVHPANLVKNQRDGVTEMSSEEQVLAEFGTVPRHVKVLPADTDISTLSLFRIGDICLTVRGTVGIEAAAFGLLVITAGTGRYDGLGFTLDPRTQPDYHATLARLATLPMPTDEQVELARRFAYGVFLDRPLELSTIRFAYAQDAAATLQIEIADGAGTTTSNAPDIQAIAAWLRSGEEDFMNSIDCASSTELPASSSMRA